MRDPQSDECRLSRAHENIIETLSLFKQQGFYMPIYMAIRNISPATIIDRETCAFGDYGNRGTFLVRKGITLQSIYKSFSINSLALPLGGTWLSRA